MSIYQLREPKPGDIIAVMHTNMGDIKLKFFPNEAPRAVENFITHAKNGYYNGIVFHRVIKDFMIQGGDPTATGMGGESIWKENFEDEFDPALHNLRGALSMANAGPGTNGSQFFIVEAKSVPANMLSQMRALADRGFPEDITAAYEELGGTPWLDFHHTVFGQVTDGMDVVDKIAETPVGDNDKPLNDVVIESIEILKAE